MLLTAAMVSMLGLANDGASHSSSRSLSIRSEHRALSGQLEAGANQQNTQFIKLNGKMVPIVYNEQSNGITIRNNTYSLSEKIPYRFKEKIEGVNLKDYLLVFHTKEAEKLGLCKDLLLTDKLPSVLDGAIIYRHSSDRPFDITWGESIFFSEVVMVGCIRKLRCA